MERGIKKAHVEEYKAVIEILQTGVLLTKVDISKITGLKKGSLANFINVLSIRYPIYQEEDGEKVKYGYLFYD